MTNGATRRLLTSARVERRLLHGDPVAEIARYASDIPESVVIVSPRWAGREAAFAPDSVTYELLDRSTMPVLLVPDTLDTDRVDGVQNVLIPVWPGSNVQALTAAVDQVTRLFDPAFRLVSIVGRDQVFEFDQKSNGVSAVSGDEELATRRAQAQLVSLVSKLRMQGSSVAWEVRHGLPGDEILRAAETTGTDLILMPGRAAGMPDRAASFRSALDLARRTSVPLMFLPMNHTEKSRSTEPLLRDDFLVSK